MLEEKLKGISTLPKSILTNALTASQNAPTDRADFVTWAKTQGVSDIITKYIASAEELPNLNFAEWSALLTIGQTKEFLSMKGEDRKAISNTIVGKEAMEAYVVWLVMTYQETKTDCIPK